jgi:hypothetical protein
LTGTTRTGTTGPTGLSGLKGTTGSTGANGTNGTTGTNGNIGNAGTTGTIGYTGNAGTTGTIGNTGNAGSGVKGMTGPTGGDGMTGPTGGDGVGPTGPLGAAGISVSGSGITGSTGYTGPTGSRFKTEIETMQISTGLLTTVGTTSTITGTLNVTNGVTIDKFFVLNKIPETSPLIFPTEFPGFNITCSFAGQYVSVCASGCIYVSNDYGSTFTYNPFPGYNIVAICMSANGAVQFAISNTTVPTVLKSDTFGVSWIFVPLSGAVSPTDYLNTIVTTFNGDKVFIGGKGTCYGSITSGSSFSAATGGVHNILSCSFRPTGFLCNGITDTGVLVVANFKLTFPASALTLTTMATIPNSVGRAAIAWNPDNSLVVYVGTAGFARSGFMSQTSTTFTVLPTPEVFIGVINCTTVIFAHSLTKVWMSKNIGTSWVHVYTGTPRSIKGSEFGDYIYILNQNGDVITKKSVGLELNTSVGNTLQSFTSSIPFISTLTIKTGASMLNLQAGVWAISFGFKMSSTGVVGDGVNIIKYGLSYTATGLDIHVKNQRYVMSFAKLPNVDSFSECVIMPITKKTNLFLNAFINMPSGLTDATMESCFINATLIST